MRQKHVVTKDEILNLNAARQKNMGKIFSRDEFCTLLKQLGYNTSSLFMNVIISGENPPFIRVARGQYAFSSNPIHIERWKQVWEDYAYHARGRQAKDSDQKQLELDINQAIKLLKDNGYKVLRPTMQYEEV